MKFLIAGLGNIGSEYAHTRHNAGFDVVEALVQRHSGSFRTDRLAAVAEIRIKGKTLVCIQPSTYMNLSGKAVKYWLDKEQIPLNQMLVVVDELALPLSRIRLRPGGSHAGHNGLRHIEEVLQTSAYPRLRFGIGNGFAKGGQVDFVLGRWTEAEAPLVEKKIGICADAVTEFVLAGIERAMNSYNKMEIAL